MVQCNTKQGSVARIGVECKSMVSGSAAAKDDSSKKSQECVAHSKVLATALCFRTLPANTTVWYGSVGKLRFHPTSRLLFIYLLLFLIEMDPFLRVIYKKHGNSTGLNVSKQASLLKWWRIMASEEDPQWQCYLESCGAFQ